MKKIIIAILVGMFFLQYLGSCAAKNSDESSDDESRKEGLKISAYLFDENTTEPAVWDDDTVFALEQLELNKVRLLAPNWGVMNMMNLNMFFEFEGGMIEVISEEKDIQLSVNDSLKPWYSDTDMNKRTFGFSISLANKGFISAAPMGAGFGNYMGTVEVPRFDGYTGREYYLTVNAYTLDNDKSPAVKARLRLVQLKDYGAADESGEMTPKQREGKSSRCFSIELTEYESSDMYKTELENGQ